MAEPKQETVLSGGTYEILRKRLAEHAEDLRARMGRLNADRKRVFGSIDPKLLATERITTEHNCTPRDIAAVGSNLIFAYNVQFGLKSTTDLADVFSIHELQGTQFVQKDLSLIGDPEFETAFANLYKYYKHTIFTRFFTSGPHLYMVFRIGKSITDIKTFKWLILPDKTLKYVDNRSDHEYRYPQQHEFEWQRVNRDYFRRGRHPHISIEDRLFIETIGGDLTIKLEDNTESGAGIYSEPVDDVEQTLDDAEILFASIGSMILLKVRPYRENSYRYLIYNEKLKEVRRIDDIGESCILLPDALGILYPSGYYLMTGEFKRFDYSAKDLLFERRITSPNGEDTLFVFHNREHGTSVLLSYNLIEQTINTPVLCHGYSFFAMGELLYFRAEDQPQKHHKIQIWQTPYVSPDYVPPVTEDSLLAKIGNRDLVKAMAECQNIINLSEKDDAFEGLYDDILRRSVAALDLYFWLKEPETHSFADALEHIRDTASAAIDEFEKVRRIRKATADRTAEVERKTSTLLRDIKPDLLQRADEFIAALAKFRALRGEIISLRELRYVDAPTIDSLEKQVIERTSALSTGCIDFLVRPDALAPYEERVTAVAAKISELRKVVDSKQLEEEIIEVGTQLETMIEVVGNLKIDDATKSAQIIDECSGLFTRLNASRAALRNKRKELQSVEAVAEFGAQVKLLDQNLVSYLDVANSPEKCDDYLNKLLVRIEELEGRFADFDEYVVVLAEKRSEMSAALEARKVTLVEEKNRKAVALVTAAGRILKGIQAKAESYKTVEEINSHFAGDLMVEKIRSLITELIGLGDSVKADDLQTRLKTTQENAVRRLKDRQDLFVEGENVIRFGKHNFSVNVQKPDLTMLMHDGEMCFHITGTNFFEPVRDEAFLATKECWQQETVAENAEVYRAEYLAYGVMENGNATAEPAEAVRQYMTPRFDEGYVKGVHDVDATIILQALLNLKDHAGLLRFDSASRAFSRIYWFAGADEERRRMEATLRTIREIRRAFPESTAFADARNGLREALLAFAKHTELATEVVAEEAAEYLFEQMTSAADAFVISPEAAHLHDEFLRIIRERHMLDEYAAAEKGPASDIAARVHLVRAWLAAFLPHGVGVDAAYVEEAAALLVTKTFDRGAIHPAKVTVHLEGLTGSHPRLQGGTMTLNYPQFMKRLRHFVRTDVPRHQEYQRLKRELTARFRDQIRLEEFQPKVLTSFVRNRLLDEVYLPLIGSNLAKQIGTVGAGKRTDFMGMLLLISPPGYGKTTLMEYVASRLGLIFMKINGPALGNRVTSIDPAEAPNAAAREEVNKINLAFEMGDNVMLYLDDIQHCNPELLQKFISLCDGQRRIEGVWKGRSRTYDLRGKKVCVVMAGNPYTETGDKFQIPDMLANRADTYNLGDIIGGSKEAFELSFIENSLTSNTVLRPLNNRSRKDIHTFIRLARGGSKENLEFEDTYGAEESSEIVNVLQKLLRIQEIVLKVNLQYIASAAQADAYRTEPPFKLQGSYRNMNKLAERVISVMNDEEVRTLIESHYEGESQTLTTGAESNLLKFRELTGWMKDEQRARWADIKSTFQRNQKLQGMDSADSMTQALVQLVDVNQGLATIRESLSPLGALPQGLGDAGRSIAEGMRSFAERAAAPPPLPPAPPPQVSVSMPPMDFPKSFQTDLSDATVEKLRDVFSAMQFKLTPPVLADSLDDTLGEEPRGEFRGVGKMRKCLETNGYQVEELPGHVFQILRDNEASIHFKVRHDRLIVTSRVDAGQIMNDPNLPARLLEMNAEIQPVSFGIERDEAGKRHLLLMESRDGKNLTRAELLEIVRAVEAASRRAAELLST